MMTMMPCSRSQGKDKEAETMLKHSVQHGQHFADAYSSLASLYAEQVKHLQYLLHNTRSFSHHLTYKVFIILDF